jgi:hypothetical protein
MHQLSCILCFVLWFEGLLLLPLFRCHAGVRMTVLHVDVEM